MRNERLRATASERAKMRALAESLKQAEEPAGHLVEGADIVEVLEWINEIRAKKGIAPFPVWERDLEAEPAMIIWRRGQALGLAKSRGRGRRARH